ncbi:hypothetical protein IE077_003382 [Cardiosporidium cionae]|uniref:Uncharacterized protein n=1 Tax=Cardiosporidium cionae TaxID=476202 RepID=A0ABQ7J8I2_9APIC|nr:hypothetical protein IE077_003382 [Cardiosporidium cionae]|eukprot:KAF8820244.1 hypothetical protein IE077_003382 [Cardiosporidium cionae]
MYFISIILGDLSIRYAEYAWNPCCHLIHWLPNTDYNQSLFTWIEPRSKMLGHCKGSVIFTSLRKNSFPISMTKEKVGAKGENHYSKWDPLIRLFHFFRLRRYKKPLWMSMNRRVQQYADERLRFPFNNEENGLDVLDLFFNLCEKDTNAVWSRRFPVSSETVALSQQYTDLLPHFAHLLQHHYLGEANSELSMLNLSSPHVQLKILFDVKNHYMLLLVLESSVPTDDPSTPIETRFLIFRRPFIDIVENMYLNNDVIQLLQELEARTAENISEENLNTKGSDLPLFSLPQQILRHALDLRDIFRTNSPVSSDTHGKKSTSYPEKQADETPVTDVPTRHPVHSKSNCSHFDEHFPFEGMAPSWWYPYILPAVHLFRIVFTSLHAFFYALKDFVYGCITLLNYGLRYCSDSLALGEALEKDIDTNHPWIDSDTLLSSIRYRKSFPTHFLSNVLEGFRLFGLLTLKFIFSFIQVVFQELIYFCLQLVRFLFRLQWLQSADFTQKILRTKVNAALIASFESKMCLPSANKSFGENHMSAEASPGSIAQRMGWLPRFSSITNFFTHRKFNTSSVESSAFNPPIVSEEPAGETSSQDSSFFSSDADIKLQKEELITPFRGWKLRSKFVFTGNSAQFSVNPTTFDVALVYEVLTGEFSSWRLSYLPDIRSTFCIMGNANVIRIGPSTAGRSSTFVSKKETCRLYSFIFPGNTFVSAFHLDTNHFLYSRKNDVYTFRESMNLTDLISLYDTEGYSDELFPPEILTRGFGPAVDKQNSHEAVVLLRPLHRYSKATEPQVMTLTLSKKDNILTSKLLLHTQQPTEDFSLVSNATHPTFHPWEDIVPQLGIFQRSILPALANDPQNEEMYKAVSMDYLMKRCLIASTASSDLMAFGYTDFVMVAQRFKNNLEESDAGSNFTTYKDNSQHFLNITHGNSLFNTTTVFTDLGLNSLNIQKLFTSDDNRVIIALVDNNRLFVSYRETPQGKTWSDSLKVETNTLPDPMKQENIVDVTFFPLEALLSSKFNEAHPNSFEIHWKAGDPYYILLTFETGSTALLQSLLKRCTCAIIVRPVIIGVRDNALYLKKRESFP